MILSGSRARSYQSLEIHARSMHPHKLAAFSATDSSGFILVVGSSLKLIYHSKQHKTCLYRAENITYRQNVSIESG